MLRKHIKQIYENQSILTPQNSSKQNMMITNPYLKTCDGVFQVERTAKWIMNLSVVHLFQNTTCTLGTMFDHRRTHGNGCTEAVLRFVLTLTILVFTLLTCANDIMSNTSCYQWIDVWCFFGSCWERRKTRKLYINFLIPLRKESSKELFF